MGKPEPFSQQGICHPVSLQTFSPGLLHLSRSWDLLPALDLYLADPGCFPCKSHKAPHTQGVRMALLNGVCRMVTPELCSAQAAQLYREVLVFFLCALCVRDIISLGEIMS